VTIAIVSAMEEENASLVESMQIENQTIIANRVYYSGTLWNQSVVVVFSRWGKVAAAATAVTLIHQFNVDEVIFTGVAGAIDPELRIGDVVIADTVFQHDMDVRPILDRHEIPLLGLIDIATEPVRSKQLYEAALVFVQQGMHDVISPQDIEKFNLSNPMVMQAALATGDQFISSASAAEDIKSRLPTAVCTEMEGAAVGQVCYEHNVPFSVVRVISDNANDNAPVDFMSFVSDVARVYSQHILKNAFEQS